jgi:hypothetical protein
MIHDSIAYCAVLWTYVNYSSLDSPIFCFHQIPFNISCPSHMGHMSVIQTIIYMHAHGLILSRFISICLFLLLCVFPCHTPLLLRSSPHFSRLALDSYGQIDIRPNFFFSLLSSPLRTFDKRVLTFSKILLRPIAI